MITDDDIDKALDFLRNKSEQHAIDKANRIYMEQFTKTVLANEMLKLTDEKSVSAKEIIARNSQVYLKQLDALKTAIQIDEHNRFLRTTAHAKIDAWQTMCANKRIHDKTI